MEEAIENARGCIGGNKSKIYSNFKFSLALGKSCKTCNQNIDCVNIQVLQFIRGMNNFLNF